MLKVRDFDPDARIRRLAFEEPKGSHCQFLHPEKGMVVGIVMAKCGRAITGKTYRLGR